MADETSQELSKTGNTAQAITAAVVAAIGALLHAGLLTASISNPILLGATIFSSFLPSLFGAKAPAPVASPLMGDIPAAPAPAPAAGGFGAAASVILQLAAILTAATAFLGYLPSLPFVPATFQHDGALLAAIIAVVTPGLQRIADLLKGA